MEVAGPLGTPLGLAETALENFRRLLCPKLAACVGPLPSQSELRLPSVQCGGRGREQVRGRAHRPVLPEPGCLFLWLWGPGSSDPAVFAHFGPQSGSSRNLPDVFIMIITVFVTVMCGQSLMLLLQYVEGSGRSMC